MVMASRALGVGGNGAVVLVALAGGPRTAMFRGVGKRAPDVGGDCVDCVVSDCGVPGFGDRWAVVVVQKEVREFRFDL